MGRITHSTRRTSASATSSTRVVASWTGCIQSLCAYVFLVAVILPSASARFTQAVVCGNNAVIQFNSRKLPCFHPNPAPGASFPPACSGSLAEVLETHLLAAASNTSHSTEVYKLDTLNVIEPNTSRHDVLGEPDVACVTGAFSNQFITVCWIVLPGEDICTGAINACGSLHPRGDAVHRDGCAVVAKRRDPSEWLAILPWHMVGRDA